MLRVTQEVGEVRRWAEQRGARPCRDPASGALWLVFPGQTCSHEEVGWGEFEPTVLGWRCVFVYDDAPSGRAFFVGPEERARRFVAEAERAHGGLPALWPPRSG